MDINPDLACFEDRINIVSQGNGDAAHRGVQGCRKGKLCFLEGWTGMCHIVCMYVSIYVCISKRIITYLIIFVQCRLPLVCEAKITFINPWSTYVY